MTDDARPLFPLDENGAIGRREVFAGTFMSLGAGAMWALVHKYPSIAAISPRKVLAQITKASPPVQHALQEKAAILRAQGVNLGNRVFVSPKGGPADPYNAITYLDPNGADTTFNYPYEEGKSIFVVQHEGNIAAYFLDAPIPDIYEKAVNKGVFTILSQPVLNTINGNDFVTFGRTTAGRNLVFNSEGNQISSLPTPSTVLPTTGIAKTP